MTRAGIGVVRRTENVLRIEKLQFIAALKGVIAGRDDVRARLKQRLRGFTADAVAVRGILAVHDGDVNSVLPLECGELLRKETAAGKLRTGASEK